MDYNTKAGVWVSTELPHCIKVMENTKSCLDMPTKELDIYMTHNWIWAEEESRTNGEKSQDTAARKMSSSTGLRCRARRAVARPSPDRKEERREAPPSGKTRHGPSPDRKEEQREAPSSAKTPHRAGKGSGARLRRRGRRGVTRGLAGRERGAARGSAAGDDERRRGASLGGEEELRGARRWGRRVA